MHLGGQQCVAVANTLLVTVSISTPWALKHSFIQGHSRKRLEESISHLSAARAYANLEILPHFFSSSITSLNTVLSLAVKDFK